MTTAYVTAVEPTVSGAFQMLLIRVAKDKALPFESHLCQIKRPLQQSEQQDAVGC